MHAEINRIATASLKDKVRPAVPAGSPTDSGALREVEAAMDVVVAAVRHRPPPLGPGDLTKKFNACGRCAPLGGSKRKTDKPTPDGPPPPTNKPPALTEQRARRGPIPSLVRPGTHPRLSKIDDRGDFLEIEIATLSEDDSVARAGQRSRRRRSCSRSIATGCW